VVEVTQVGMMVMMMMMIMMMMVMMMMMTTTMVVVVVMMMMVARGEDEILGPCGRAKEDVVVEVDEALR
jgi:hypothetical protein